MELTTISEEILNKLAEAASEEEFASILADNNISIEDAAAFVKQLQIPSEELNEDDLDDVVGGASTAVLKAAFIGIKYIIRKAKKTGILGGPLKPIKFKK